MLSDDAGFEITRDCERSPMPKPEGSSERPDRSARGFAALAQTSLGSRFVSWPGPSGKSYVFSVFAASACPAFCDAVLLAVARYGDGARRILAAVDTGAFPEPILARVQREFSPFAGALEFHVHLLARSSMDRSATLADLTATCDPVPRSVA